MASSGHGPGVAVVALLASAGGLEALSTVLCDLTPDFPAAVVVQQHLGGHTSVLPTILGRLTGRSVGWAREGQALTPGQVVVCPPEMLLELTPDGRCRLHTGLNHGTQGSDVLLASVASSYGSTGAAMVLSGSGHDGAAGVAMKRAGAIVIAESPSTARYPWMPIAAARAGADLVLDIDEIGHVLSSIVAGAPLPKPRKSPAQAPVDDDVGFATYDVLDRLEPKFSTNRARPGASSPACARPSCTQAPGADGGDRRYAGDGGHGAAAGPGNHVSERNLLIRPPRKHPLVARI